MPPSTSSSSSAAAWLPAEVLLDVFGHLDSPLDLYQSSLACRSWRSSAIDSRLWQSHYWRFYRPSGTQNDELSRSYDHSRHEAMRIWLNTPSALPPEDAFYAFLYPHSASGNVEPSPILVKGLLRIVKAHGMAALSKIRKELLAFSKQQWGPQGPDNPAEATPQLLKHLNKLFGIKGPSTAAERYYAEDRFDFLVKKLAGLLPPKHPKMEPLTLSSMPHFLRKGIARKNRLPDFHAHFIERMNSDERLLADLRGYIHLDNDTLDNMLDLVNEYGDKGRDFLAALAKVQHITVQAVGIFTTEAGEKADGGQDSKAAAHAEEKKSLRAINVHTRAAADSSQPLRSSCLSLQHAARHLVGHLQRREAIKSLKELRDVWTSPSKRPRQTLRDQVVKSCIGVEEALEALTLFHSGSKSELREYLDLLALYVWATLKSEDRSMVAHGYLNPAKYPTTSRYGLSMCTRQLVTNIHGILRSLDFGVIGRTPDGFYDPHNNFLHVSLWCPGQRHSLPLTGLAIICAVARRLGVAATIAGTPDRPTAVVIEDGSPLEDWPKNDPDEEWGRFYIASGFINKEIEEIVLEVGGIKKWLTDRRLTRGRVETASLESAPDPVSPLTILEWVGIGILGTLQRGPQLPSGPSEDSGSPDEATATPMAVKPKTELSALRAFLLGQTPHPPAPLFDPIFPSTLTFLPSTQAGTPRVNFATARLDAEYAATWALRVVAPHLLGGPQEADGQIIGRFLAEEPEFFAADGAFQGDVMLLFEVNGADVEAERQAAWYAEAEDLEESDTDSEEEESSRSDPPRAPMFLRRFAAGIMALDKMTSNGLGGTGGGKHGLRMAKKAAELDALDPSAKENGHVEYRVGTVFKHRVYGYYGVILGWDTTHRATEMQLGHIPVDGALTIDDVGQPFYHVLNAHDERHHYVSQRSIDPVRVPASATDEEVSALLGKLVPLFNLRTVGKCFSTVRLEPCAAKAEGARSKGKGKAIEGERESKLKASGRGEVKLVMNEWMSQAWPYD